MTLKKTLFDTVLDGLTAELTMLSEVAGDRAPRSLVWSAKTRALTLPERFARQERFAYTADQLAAIEWPVTTRRTGGGITPQGPGVLNLALSFPVPPAKARSVTETYAAICDPLVEAFSYFGITSKPGSVRGSFCDGDFNLEVEGRKLVGTAQRWRGATVLCHALILTDIDLKPAVHAAQLLADGLGLNHTYQVSRHTRLADLTAAGETDLCGALEGILQNRGFATS